MNNPSWLDFVSRLRLANVKFVIVGGHAVNFHGYLRTTEDLDLIFLREPETESEVLSALVEFNAFWIGDEIDPETGLEIIHPITIEYFRRHQ
ncbi:MAG: hypothetical protein KDB03_26085 [Planctomycetales bacterium]|nr:hypothetical protein [Planctomycetales bacterium]